MFVQEEESFPLTHHHESKSFVGLLSAVDSSSASCEVNSQKPSCDNNQSSSPSWNCSEMVSQRKQENCQNVTFHRSRLISFTRSSQVAKVSKKIYRAQVRIIYLARDRIQVQCRSSGGAAWEWVERANPSVFCWLLVGCSMTAKPVIILSVRVSASQSTSWNLFDDFVSVSLCLPFHYPFGGRKRRKKEVEEVPLPCTSIFVSIFSNGRRVLAGRQRWGGGLVTVIE